MRVVARGQIDVRLLLPAAEAWTGQEGALVHAGLLDEARVGRRREAGELDEVVDVHPEAADAHDEKGCERSGHGGSRGRKSSQPHCGHAPEGTASTLNRTLLRALHRAGGTALACTILAAVLAGSGSAATPREQDGPFRSQAVGDDLH